MMQGGGFGQRGMVHGGMPPQPMGGKGMRPNFVGGPANMPPASHYQPMQKMENPEYQALGPGQATMFKGYKQQSISEKGQRLMNKYEEVMGRPQGEFPDVYSATRAQKYAGGGAVKGGGGPMMGGKGMMMQGMGMGGMGGKGGMPAPGPGGNVCRYFKSPAGCRNGDTCRFSHDVNAKPPTGPPQQAGVPPQFSKGAAGAPKPHSIKVKCRNLPNCTFGEQCRFQH